MNHRASVTHLGLIKNQNLVHYPGQMLSLVRFQNRYPTVTAQQCTSDNVESNLTCYICDVTQLLRGRPILQKPAERHRVI